LEHDHLNRAVLERLLAEDRTEEENRCLLHLIAVCPECRKAGGYLLDLHRAGALPPLFGPVDLALAHSRGEAPRLWERLARHPHERRLALVRATRRFASWGLCELLCRESRTAAVEDSRRSAELAELAVLVADALEEGSPFEAGWVYQLRALAWAHLGNAHRSKGDVQLAEEAFSMSDPWWEAGEEAAGDALGYGPDILTLKAPLRSDQRRFPEALALLDRALAGYLHCDPEHRDLHLAGRVLVKKAYVLTHMAEPERALLTLQEAERLVDPDRDPRLLLCLRHNLLDNLASAGRFAEARDLLPEVKALCGSAGSRLDEIRLLWVEGRIAAGLGDRNMARQAFGDARREFATRGMGYDAALISLELAVLLIDEGKTAEVRELAEEMTEIFQPGTSTARPWPPSPSSRPPPPSTPPPPTWPATSPPTSPAPAWTPSCASSGSAEPVRPGEPRLGHRRLGAAADSIAASVARDLIPYPFS
jgi:tetratricopeptide (TPR) repeat protein